MSKKPGQKIVKCSFCGRDGNEVGSMIAGPDVYICDICIGSSVDILKNNLKISDKKSEYRFNAFWDTSLFQIIINHQNKI